MSQHKPMTASGPELTHSIRRKQQAIIADLRESGFPAGQQMAEIMEGILIQLDQVTARLSRFRRDRMPR